VRARHIMGITVCIAFAGCGGDKPPPAQPTTTTAAEPKPTIDKQALIALRTMSDFLASQRNITVHAEGSIEVVMQDGQKIELDHDSDIAMRRPDGLRSDRVGRIASAQFYYDGKNFTLYERNNNYYATATAPPTVDQALDVAREKYGLETAAADLLYTRPYEVMTEDLVAATYVGIGDLHDVRCHHLAIREKEVDWQIWIAADAQPLPHKLVITSTTVKGSPEFRTELTRWSFPASLPNELFEFIPPQGAKRIDFLPRGGQK